MHFYHLNRTLLLSNSKTNVIISKTLNWSTIKTATEFSQSMSKSASKPLTHKFRLSSTQEQ